MTKEQSAAFVIAQSVCAMAEIEAMKAANVMREMQGRTIAYGEEAFNDVVHRFCIHHNGVITTFQEAE